MPDPISLKQFQGTDAYKNSSNKGSLDDAFNDLLKTHSRDGTTISQDDLTKIAAFQGTSALEFGDLKHAGVTEEKVARAMVGAFHEVLKGGITGRGRYEGTVSGTSSTSAADAKSLSPEVVARLLQTAVRVSNEGNQVEVDLAMRGRLTVSTLDGAFDDGGVGMTKLAEDLQAAGLEYPFAFAVVGESYEAADASQLASIVGGQLSLAIAGTAGGDEIVRGNASFSVARTGTTVGIVLPTIEPSETPDVFLIEQPKVAIAFDESGSMSDTEKWVMLAGLYHAFKAQEDAGQKEFAAYLATFKDGPRTFRKDLKSIKGDTAYEVVSQLAGRFDLAEAGESWAPKMDVAVRAFQGESGADFGYDNSPRGEPLAEAATWLNAFVRDFDDVAVFLISDALKPASGAEAVGAQGLQAVKGESILRWNPVAERKARE